MKNNRLSFARTGRLFFCVLFPNVYPSPKQDKPKLNTAVRPSIVNIGIPTYCEIPYKMVSM